METIHLKSSSPMQFFIDLLCGSLAMLCYLPGDVKVVVNDINGNLTKFFHLSVSSSFEATTGSCISYNEGNTDTGIPAWGKIALGITGAAIAIGILAGTMGGMAAVVSVGSELLLGSLLGGVTDAAISLACGERDTNELLHDFADGAIDGFMFTGIFAPIGAAGAVSRYAKNAEGFVSKGSISKGSISKAGYGVESGINYKNYKLSLTKKEPMNGCQHSGSNCRQLQPNMVP